MFLTTADITHNTTTPGDNSGWQYEGKFMSFLGVPIGPYFFITAKHLGGSVGTTFDLHGDVYTTIAKHESPTTDLVIWEVNHSKPFPTYAPLSSGVNDIGATMMVFGRGTRKGTDVMLGPELRGWTWGPSDDVKRWGRNVVVNTLAGGPALGELIYCDFNNPGIEEECHLSVGDSGGGMFVMENGLWRLAGINYAVDGDFRIPPAGAPMTAPIFDLRGFEYQISPGVWTLIAGANPIPSSFYASRISASLPWIEGIPGMVSASSLAQESFAAWQKLYFSPAQIAAPATTGALADFDADGISNLMEFALNTEPIFNARTSMTAATGLSGLPLVRLENISGADHVTIEFVRRTASSGAGLTYTPQFSSDLLTWEAVGTETVTAINPRWERVKVVDPQTTGSSPKRLARLNVTLAP